MRMNISTPNGRTGSRRRVTRSGSATEFAIRPAPAPIERVIRAADVLRDERKVASTAVRYVSALEAKDAGKPALKRSAIGNRRWQLVQDVRALRGSRAA